MENQTSQENKMGVMPVGRLLFTMSLPMMLSMLVQALYNVVDSMFVSRVSEDALAALSMAFPIQNLMIAAAAGLGVGLNAVLSRALGAKEPENVKRAAASGLLLELMAAALFTLGGATIVRAFFEAQTSIPTIVESGVAYTRIVMLGCVGVFVQIYFERLLQSTGRTVLTMVSQATGALINIALDPVLIFGLLGMPRMGVAGAALATVIGQWCSAALGCFLNLRFNPDVRLAGARVRAATLARILKIGVPSVVMQSIGSVMTFLMNQILIAFSSTAVAVFGVYFKLQSFIFMPVFGLNNGTVPIVAFNYGARHADRVRLAVRYTVVTAMCIMTAGLAVFQLMPGTLLNIFDASDELLRIGMPALRIISLSFPVAGFCIGCGSVFQALGYSVYSMIVSLVRQLFVLIPCAYLLGRVTGNVNSVWWAFVIAETFSLALTVVFYRRIDRAVIRKM